MTAPDPRGQVTVREATDADAAVVGTLLHDFNAEFGAATDSPTVVAARFPSLAASGQLVVLLAGDPPVGFAAVAFRPVLYADGPVAIIDELYVRPERRDRRLGHALLVAAEALARQRGGDLVEINVDGEDHDARRFYEAHGYAHTEPGQAEPALYYQKALRAP